MPAELPAVTEDADHEQCTACEQVTAIVIRVNRDRGFKIRLCQICVDFRNTLGNDALAEFDRDLMARAILATDIPMYRA